MARTQTGCCQVCGTLESLSGKKWTCQATWQIATITNSPLAWDTVTLDFIEGLSKSNKYNTILVVINKFTKSGHFIPIKHPFTAATIAQVLWTMCTKIVAWPRWSFLIGKDFHQRILATTLQVSRHYDQSELLISSANRWANRTIEPVLEAYLCCLLHAKPKQWEKWIPQAEYWYTTAHHSALGKSPFEVLYGWQPRYFAVQLESLPGQTDVETWLQELSYMLPLIR
jgi:hypothetical protein